MKNVENGYVSAQTETVFRCAIANVPRPLRVNNCTGQFRILSYLRNRFLPANRALRSFKQLRFQVTSFRVIMVNFGGGALCTRVEMGAGSMSH